MLVEVKNIDYMECAKAAKIYDYAIRYDYCSIEEQIIWSQQQHRPRWKSLALSKMVNINEQ